MGQDKIYVHLGGGGGGTLFPSHRLMDKQWWRDKTNVHVFCFSYGCWSVSPFPVFGSCFRTLAVDLKDRKKKRQNITLALVVCVCVCDTVYVCVCGGYFFLSCSWCCLGYNENVIVSGSIVPHTLWLSSHCCAFQLYMNMGFTSEDLDAFFGGPAFLAW